MRSAQLAVEVLERNGIFSPQLSIILSEAADEASHAHDAFASIQPPSRSLDAYRTRLDRALMNAARTLAKVRIAARRTDPAAVASEAEPLPAIGATLERFAGVEA